MRYLLPWILTACGSPEIDTDACSAADLQFSGTTTRASADGPDTSAFAVGDDVFAVGTVENSCGAPVRLELTDCGLIARVTLLDSTGAEVDSYDIDVDCANRWIEVPANGEHEYSATWTSAPAGTYAILLTFRDENGTEATTPEFVVQ